MPYHSYEDLISLGFAHVGQNVRVSDRASIYNPDQISLHDNCRIDDFCVVSGNVTVGKYVHIAPYCLIAGGEPGIILDDFSGLAYGVKVFTQSDDYSGKTLTNPNIPKIYKNEFKSAIRIERHVIVGAGSMIFPGANLAEGTSVGAMSLVRKSTLPWGIYVGNPAKRVKERSTDLLMLEQQFLSETIK